MCVTARACLPLERSERYSQLQQHRCMQHIATMRCKHDCTLRGCRIVPRQRLCLDWKHHQICHLEPGTQLECQTTGKAKAYRSELYSDSAQLTLFRRRKAGRGRPSVRGESTWLHISTGREHSALRSLGRHKIDCRTWRRIECLLLQMRSVRAVGAPRTCNLAPTVLSVTRRDSHPE